MNRIAAILAITILVITAQGRSSLAMLAAPPELERDALWADVICVGTISHTVYGRYGSKESEGLSNVKITIDVTRVLKGDIAPGSQVVIDHLDEAVMSKEQFSDFDLILLRKNGNGYTFAKSALNSLPVSKEARSIYNKSDDVNTNLRWEMLNSLQDSSYKIVHSALNQSYLFSNDDITKYVRPRLSDPNESIRWEALATCLVSGNQAPVAAKPDEKSDRNVNRARPDALVRECLDTVRSNRGGDCGTPELMAHYDLVGIGKPVVPFLILELKSDEMPDIVRFIRGALSEICCYSFDATRQDDLVSQTEKWWRLHRYQTEQDWILDAIGNGDYQKGRVSRVQTKKLTNQWDMIRLVSLLKSERKDVAGNALYILWENFKSEEALDYVRDICRHGTREQKMMVLGFCGDRHNRGNQSIRGLSPVVAEVLENDKDFNVIIAALETAAYIHAVDCLPAIEKMELKPLFDSHKYHIIRALAELKGKAYGERILYYLKNGDKSERLAAIQSINYSICSEEAITPLLIALKDPELRWSACISLRTAVSDKNTRNRINEIVPLLIELLREKGESCMGDRAHDVLNEICITHFGQTAPPKVDTSLGGSRFSEKALPIWEKWWDWTK